MRKRQKQTRNIETDGTEFRQIRVFKTKRAEEVAKRYMSLLTYFRCSVRVLQSAGCDNTKMTRKKCTWDGLKTVRAVNLDTMNRKGCVERRADQDTQRNVFGYTDANDEQYEVLLGGLFRFAFGS